MSKGNSAILCKECEHWKVEVLTGTKENPSMHGWGTCEAIVEMMNICMRKDNPAYIFAGCFSSLFRTRGDFGCVLGKKKNEEGENDNVCKCNL